MAEVPEIDGYSDLVQVAKGGFGTVYRASQDRFGRVVAIKVLNVSDLDDRARQRFERECIAMGSLGWHPNVVAVFDSGITDGGQPYLVMEYLDAGSLGDRLAGGPLPWQEAVVTGVQVAGALGAAHAAGTLHRDLKPENLLVGPFGETKLGDFGIAAVDGAARTTTGHASFTVLHVAPEILQGQRPDELSDIYGLASTVYSLIAGSPPFAGDDDEPPATLMMRVLQAPPPQLRDVPGDLADLLARTLAKDSSERPQAAAEFGRLLQTIQSGNGEPVTDLRVARTTPTVTPLVDATEPGGPAEPAEPRQGDPRPTFDHTAASSIGDSRPTIGSAAARTPEIDMPASEGAPPDATRPPPHTRRKVIAWLAALAIAAAIAGGLVLSTRNNPSRQAADSAASPSTEATSASASASSDIAPSGVAATNTVLWVANDGFFGPDHGPLTRIDPATNEITDTINVGNDTFGFGVAATRDAVWVANDTDGTVSRVDPATNEVVDTVSVADGVTGVAATNDAAWVASASERTVTRIDASTNEITATIAVGAFPSGLDATDDAVWVANNDDGTVTRIDAATNLVVETINVGAGPNAVAATDDAVWVTHDGIDDAGNTVTRIDPTSNRPTATINLNAFLRGVAATNDAVWVAGEDGVTLLDPATNQATDTIDIGGFPVGVSVTDFAVWVTSVDSGTVTRIDPETLGVTSIDLR